MKAGAAFLWFYKGIAAGQENRHGIFGYNGIRRDPAVQAKQFYPCLPCFLQRFCEIRIGTGIGQETADAFHLDNENGPSFKAFPDAGG